MIAQALLAKCALSIALPSIVVVAVGVALDIDSIAGVGFLGGFLGVTLLIADVIWSIWSF